MKLSVATAVAMSAAMVLSACNGAGDDTAEPEVAEQPTAENGEDEDVVASLYEAAQEEPPLVWYSAQSPGPTEALVDAFREEYPGVELEGLRLTSGPMAARYAEEQGAGVVNADLITIGDPNFIDQGLEEGWFVDIDQSELPALEELPEEWFINGSAVVSISLLGFAYNTERVDTAPQTWEDITDPEYRGEIILGDPRTVPSYMAMVRIWRDEIGDDFLEGLAEQDLILAESVVPATEQLGAGEVSIVFPNVRHLADPAIEAGAPLEFVVPELTTGVEYITILSEDSSSPNAARLLYNFLLTEKGQIAYNGTTSASPFGELGETDPLPDDYREPNIRELPEHEADLIQLLGLS